MGLAATVLAGVGTVTAGVIVKVLADDVKEWTPKITERLIKAAVQWLPEDQRERYGEEWAGHVWETPGTLAKILVIITLPLAVLEARERHARVALEIWSGQYYAVIGRCRQGLKPWRFVPNRAIVLPDQT